MPIYSDEKMMRLRQAWEAEEKTAHIEGWDFSHIDGRYSEGEGIPWDYEQIVRENLRDDMKLLDYDTGGGEFLLSLGHPRAMNRTMSCADRSSFLWE